MRRIENEHQVADLFIKLMQSNIFITCVPHRVFWYKSLVNKWLFTSDLVTIQQLVYDVITRHLSGEERSIEKSVLKNRLENWDFMIRVSELLLNHSGYGNKIYLAPLKVIEEELTSKDVEFPLLAKKLLKEADLLREEIYKT